MPSTRSAENTVRFFNAFTTGNPFWGTSLLEVSIKRGFGVIMGLNLSGILGN